MEPPWVPKSNVVYAKDTGEFRDISEEVDVEFDDKDEIFYKKFNTGAVPIQWQKEMIESGVFDQLDCLLLNGHGTAKSRTCAIM